MCVVIVDGYARKLMAINQLFYREKKLFFIVSVFHARLNDAIFNRYVFWKNRFSFIEQLRQICFRLDFSILSLKTRRFLFQLLIQLSHSLQENIRNTCIGWVFEYWERRKWQCLIQNNKNKSDDFLTNNSLQLFELIILKQHRYQNIIHMFRLDITIVNCDVFHI